MTEAKTIEFKSSEGFPIAADVYGEPSNNPVLFMHGGGQTRHAWGGAAAVASRLPWSGAGTELGAALSRAWQRAQLPPAPPRGFTALLAAVRARRERESEP